MSKKSHQILALLEALKNQTNELLVNQLLYNEMVDNSADGLLVVDNDGIIRFGNKMAAKMLNFKKNEKLEGEEFGFTPIENEATEIKIASGNKVRNVEMRARKIAWENRWGMLVVLRPFADQSKLKSSLQKTSASLKTMISASPLAIILVDIGWTVSLWSKAASDIFGWNEQQMRGQHFPFENTPLEEVFERAFAGERLSKLEISGQFGLYGFFKILNVWATPLKDATGMLSGVMLMIADNTEFKLNQKKAAQALQQSEERFRMVLRNSPISVSSQDADLRYTWAYNPLAGLQESQMIGKTDAELFAPENAEQLTKLKISVLKSGYENRGEIKVQRDGQLYFYDVSAEPLMDNLGHISGVACTATDISILRHTESLATFALRHDALTGLPNRAVFRDRLQQVLVLAQRDNTHSFAVMHCGIDQFKMVNQCFGHMLGDQLLQDVGVRLAQALYEIDTVSRIGGDEFLILVYDIHNTQDATCIVRKIIAAMQQPFMLNEQEIYLSVSIGIAVYPEDGAATDDLLKNSNIAMHRAKEDLGRGNYQFFCESMNSHAMQRFNMENDLHRAMENGEFHLHYQPQVDIKDKRIIAVEALIRWQHPDKGNISPEEFIPVAESSHLIVAIGEWVLHTACQQHKAWLEAGLDPMRIAVNLSARQFMNGDLVNKVANAINASGIAPEYLELELTESMLMADAENTIDTLHALKQMGVRLSIDDFGTGYSSLSYLKRFPLDILKIDRSFVTDLGSATDRGEIPQAIIAMAHALNLKVIAEGVENQQQLDFLRDSRCEFAQGYFFSKALPAEECSKLLKNRSVGLFVVSDRSLVA